MIVLDASAALDLLLRDSQTFERIRQRLLAEGPVAAPHLLDAEVANALRSNVRAGKVDDARAADALVDLGTLPLERHPLWPLLERVWQLRHNLSAYDATYVALAEALDAPLLTCDERLAKLPASVSAARIENARNPLS